MLDSNFICAHRVSATRQEERENVLSARRWKCRTRIEALRACPARRPIRGSSVLLRSSSRVDPAWLKPSCICCFRKRFRISPNSCQDAMSGLEGTDRCAYEPTNYKYLDQRKMQPNHFAKFSIVHAWNLSMTLLISGSAPGPPSQISDSREKWRKNNEQGSTWAAILPPMPRVGQAK